MEGITMKRSITAAVAVAALALTAVPAGAATTAPGLGGTTLTDTTPTGTSSCSDYGSTGQYSVDGTVTLGSYPGAYTESGTFTAGAFTAGRSYVTGWQATFKLVSANGTVTGTKTLVPGTSTARTYNCGSGYLGDWFSAGADKLVVDATIALPDGRTCSYKGFSNSTLGVKTPTIQEQYLTQFLNDVNAPTATCGDIVEPTPEPSGPKTKDDCMNGGWQQFGFPNQGQCIKAVNHQP
jgi:hypothetical protein